MHILDFIRCPVCGERLHPTEGSILCPNGHTYDIARQGYVNFLPPGKASNPRSGDDRGMLEARRRFLSKGYYDRFDDTVSDLVCRRDAEGTVLMDLGCGDGYHTVRTVREIFGHTGRGVMALGFDASKNGAVMACRLAEDAGLHSRGLFTGPDAEGPEAHFLPANIFRLPVAGQCADAVISMFAPIPWDEVRRILKPGGELIVVSAGREHLIEMRQVIYEKVEIGDFRPEAPSGFGCTGTKADRYTISVGKAEDLEDLLKMTPHYYRATGGRKEELRSRGSMDLTVDVNYTVFGVDV